MERNHTSWIRFNAKIYHISNGFLMQKLQKWLENSMKLHRAKKAGIIEEQDKTSITLWKYGNDIMIQRPTVQNRDQMDESNRDTHYQVIFKIKMRGKRAFQ